MDSISANANQADRATHFSDVDDLHNNRNRHDNCNDNRNDIQDALREESQRSGVALWCRSSGFIRFPFILRPSHDPIWDSWLSACHLDSIWRSGLMTALTPGPAHGSRRTCPT
jgi:hypothetical protein